MRHLVEWASGSPILMTKLHIPRAVEGTIVRQRLIDRIGRGAGSGSKLTFVCAPAGFGKSTLLAHWVQQTDARPAWYSVDPRDNDPARFWQYVIAAIDVVHPGFAEKTDSVVKLMQPAQYEWALTTLLNELQQLQPPAMLVLDDFHEVSDEGVLASFAYFIEYLPEHVHVIVASRSELPVPTARWLGNQWMTRLDTADMRFTPQEGSAFYADCMALDLPPGQVDEWVRRTEGWITAMKLAALAMRSGAEPPASLRDSPLEGNMHLLEQYLLEGMFLRLSEDTRRFLTDCSVLRRMSAPLCRAVSGYERSQDMLEQLERRQLFTTPLDERKEWFRFHHLFAAFLHRRLERTEPERIPPLLERAGAWCEREGLLEEALDYYLDGGHYERGVGLLRAMTAKRLRTSPVWLGARFARIPAHLLMKHPILYFSYVHMMMVDTRYDEADRLLRGAEQGFAEYEHGWTEEDKQDFWGSYYYLRMIHTSIVHGDREQTLRYMELFRQHAPAGTRLIFAQSGIAGQPSIVQKFVRGDKFVDKAANIALLDNMVQSLGELGSSMQTCLAEGLYGYDELTEAAATAENALRVATHWDPHALPEILLAARLVLSRTQRAWGSRREAEETLRQTRREIIELGMAGSLIYCDAELALLALEEGDREPAEAWLRFYRMSGDDVIAADRLYEYQYLARIYAALDRPEEAARLAVRAMETAERAERLYMSLELAVLQATTLLRMKRSDEALAALRPVLAAAEPRGYVRLFLDAGEPMAELLAKVIRSRDRQGEGDMPSLHYVRGLLAGFGKAAPASGSPPDLSLILTPKELEILRLLVGQKTNREIAAELGIGYGTVRSHLHNIYGKLMASDRAEAIDIGKRSGIIPNSR